MADKKSSNSELFHSGELSSAAEWLGCTCIKKRDEYIYTFRTYAPRAETVHLASDYNGWCDTLIPLTRCDGGIWECTVISPFTLDGYAYKFLIKSDTSSCYKGDPYAKYSKGGYDGASLIWTSSFEWSDGEWLAARREKAKQKCCEQGAPINVYTVYPSDFAAGEDGKNLTYRDLAASLVPYIKFMGYTHLRLLSVFNAEGDPESGGMTYPDYRHGTPDDLKFLVNELHARGIGIIFDLNATYTSRLEWGLTCFDGTPLYEREDSPDRLNTSSNEVRSYILSSISYILQEYHPDGIHIGGLSDTRDEDIKLLDRIKKLLDSKFTDVIFLTELSKTSSACTNINLVYNASFAEALHDYLSSEPAQRTDRYERLVGTLRAGGISPIERRADDGSGRSIIDSINAPYDDKFRLMRAVMLLYMALPTKKDTLMGTELAQFSGRERGRALEWFMLDYPSHRKMRQYISALNRFYARTPELWSLDTEEGFRLISSNGNAKSLVLERSASGSRLFVALNVSSESQCIKIPTKRRLSCVFSSEESMQSERLTELTEDTASYITVSLPPYSARIYKSIQVNNKIIL